MIVQQWCACGAGVCGESDERATVEAWAAAHPLTCLAGLVPDQPITVSYGCPACAYRSYGRTSAEAAEDLAGHRCRGGT